MTNSELIQKHHLNRRAVVYIRQSTGHQILSNVESQKMQLAMGEHAERLGWVKDRIDIVDEDTGRSAEGSVNRDGYKSLLSEVALGQIGIVISYESARLSRNCSDWYPLLDVCAFKQCLIADRDGLYDPSTPNGRLLLGMKGMMSELELHTLRGRLTAGIQNKARRGELVIPLPAGLVRVEDGRVVKEPDLQVQEAIELVFNTFVELRSASKVLRHFNAHGLRVPKRNRNQETVWRPATQARVVGILRNPAYAGAFVYGKTYRVDKLDRGLHQRKKKPMSEWSVVKKDQYPGYVSWETFERIQQTLRDNHAEYKRKLTRGVPREGNALLQGIVFCGKCGHKMIVQFKGGSRYLCNQIQRQRHGSTCQMLMAEQVDQWVVEAFFLALSPAELDLYEKAMRSRTKRRSDVDAAQQREIQRLRYEVELAQRQYDCVDPGNRLVASELERRWELSLRTLREAEEKIEREHAERDKVVPLSITRELRRAFQELGESLPTLWKSSTLRRSQRKALLRCLIEKVVIRRKEQKELVHVRIVWKGGAITESDVPLRVGSLADLSRVTEMESMILDLEAAGQSDDEIASTLTERGFRSPQRDVVLRTTVQKIRLRNGRIHRYSGPRSRRVEGFITLRQVAEEVGAKPQRLYGLIRRGRLDIKREPKTKLYLFPDDPETIEKVRRLHNREIDQVSI